jgi:hypothetical protein
MKYVVLFLALLASPAWADDDLNPPHQFFYRGIDKNWDVFGNTYPDHAKRHDTCSISRGWDDGSAFQVSKDLNQNTLYLWVQIMDWNVTDPKGTEEDFRLNAFRNGKFTGTKNIMYSVNLNEPKFLDVFSTSTVIKFIPPGSIGNFSVSIDGLGPKLINALADCIRASKDAGSVPTTKLPNMDSPIADKKKDSL